MNATVRRAIQNSAEFIRDLWLARAPYKSGKYAQGLTHAGSIRVSRGRVEIINHAKHAQAIEMGVKSYNLAMAILNSGKGVKISKEGYRYKKIKIEESPAARYRKPSVAQSVQKSFSKLAPLGMRPNSLTKYGGIRSYTARKRLQKPLKPQKTTNIGLFTISEKAQKANPNKWQIPEREGRNLARDVHRDAKPLISDAIRKAVQQERDRQKRTKGKVPAWYNPAMARNPVKNNPVSGVRK